MSDRLKSYIQEHKNLLDQKQPPADLFDKIISQTSQVKTVKKMSASKIRSFRLYYAAAALISGSALLFWFMGREDQVIQGDQQKAEFAQKTAPLSQPAFRKSETKTSAEFETAGNTEKTEAPTNNAVPQSKNVISHSKKVRARQIAKTESEKIAATDIAKDQNTPLISQEIKANPAIPAEKNPVQSETMKDPEIASVESKDVVKTDPNEIITQESVAQNHSTPDAREAAKIGQLIESGFFGWLAKKTDEWTGSKVVIAPSKKEDRTVFAFNVNTSYLKLSRSVTLP